MDVNESDLVKTLTSLLHTLNEKDWKLQSELQSNTPSIPEMTTTTTAAFTTTTTTMTIEVLPKTMTATTPTTTPSIDLTQKTRPK